MLVLACVFVWMFLNAPMFGIKTFYDVLNGIFPKPHVNGFYGYSEKFYEFLYTALLIYFVIILLYNGIIRRISTSHVSLPAIQSAAISKSLIAMICILAVLQMIGHARYFSTIYAETSTMNESQKKSYTAGFVYDFAVRCHPYFIEGHYNARLITDLDINESFGMTLHRYLAYYLYPVKIRYKKAAREPDYLIYFQKNGAVALVPDDFEVLLTVDDENILAARKDVL